jgi:Ser-tRNA(Ala) deacylase AlaX
MNGSASVRCRAVYEGGMSEYDTDILTWSEHQADLLRRMGAGERVNDQVDWQNVAEEIEDVGRSQLHAVEHLLTQALRHMLKAEAWPLHRDAPSWRADAIDFRRQARRRFVPSMRQKIDVASLYADALAAMPETVDGQPPLPVPQECPMLDELLSDEP